MANLIWESRALSSLRSHDLWLRERNPAAAMSFRAEIETVAGLIAEFPMLGPTIPGTGLRHHVTRRYRYRIVYRIAHNAVYIEDILHPRQR